MPFMADTVRLILTDGTDFDLPQPGVVYLYKTSGVVLIRYGGMNDSDAPLVALSQSEWRRIIQKRVT